MIKLRRILTIGFALSVMLTACAPTTAEPARSTLRPLPTLPTAAALSTREPAGAGVPVFAYFDQGAKLLVVSSVTGKALDKFTPLELASSYSYALSPDGKMLAVLSAVDLYLIGLPTWKYRTFDTGLHGSPGKAVYSADGNLVALASAGPDSYLQIVDTRSGKVRAGSQTGIAITNIRFTRDESALMVYGPNIAKSGVAANAGISAGAPRVALFATSDLKELWSAELTGMRAGSFPKKEGAEITQDIYQPGAAWHFEPGIAFAPDRDALYAVHGDEDKLTTVDFSARKVSTVDVLARSGWLDQWMALTAGVAYAKGMDGTSKQALISPDGKTLYVTGTSDTVTVNATSGNWDFTSTPLGLQVIATEDGALVDKVDTQASMAALAPDGQHVLLSGWVDDNYLKPWTDVYDSSSRSIVKRVAGVSLLAARRIDGQAILVSSNSYSDSACNSTTVDPQSWTITNHWTGPCFEWLNNP